MELSENKLDNSRIAKNTIYLYIRTGVTMLVSLYTSRVILNALGIEDFGIWGVLGGIVSMFSFINQSLSSSIFRYLAHAIGLGDKEVLNKTYNASIIIHIFLAIIIFILCETIGQWFLSEKLVVPDAKREMSNIVFHIVIITSCISLLSVPFNSVIIAYERMNVYAYLAISDVCLKLLISYLVYIIPSNKLIWYACMMLVVSCSMLLFYYIYVRVNFKFLSFQKGKDLQLFKSLLGFSGWSLFGNIAYVGYTQGLNMLINMFFGPVVNAARAISLQIEQTVRTFVTNFQTAMNPQIIKSYAGNNLNQMHMLILRSSKFSVFLLFIFALPIILEADTILTLWLKQVPEHTVAFVRIMFLVITLETMSNPLGIGVVATSDIKKYHVVVGSVLMTIVPISYFVLKGGAPPESVFIVYLIIEVIAVFLRLLIAHEKVNLPVSTFIYNVMLRCLIVMIIGSIIPVILRMLIPDGIIRFLVVCVVSVISAICAIYYCGLDAHERKVIIGKIRTKLCK